MGRKSNPHGRWVPLVAPKGREEMKTWKNEKKCKEEKRKNVSNENENEIEKEDGKKCKKLKKRKTWK